LIGFLNKKDTGQRQRKRKMKENTQKNQAKTSNQTNE
jgi:hypothetical protein